MRIRAMLTAALAASALLAAVMPGAASAGKSTGAKLGKFDSATTFYAKGAAMFGEAFAVLHGNTEEHVADCYVVQKAQPGIPGGFWIMLDATAANMVRGIKERLSDNVPLLLRRADRLKDFAGEFPTTRPRATYISHVQRIRQMTGDFQTALDGLVSANRSIGEHNCDAAKRDAARAQDTFASASGQAQKHWEALVLLGLKHKVGSGDLREEIWGGDRVLGANLQG